MAQTRTDMRRPLSLFALLSLVAALRLAAACLAQPFPPEGAVSLFDGQSLGQWKDSEYGFPNLIEVRDSTIIIGMADGLSGITWTGDYPRTNYEIGLEAMRVLGGDFFCGLTFPVGEGHCTLVVGGWGGVVVGLSNVDGLDASDNEHSILKRFDNGRWYRIRLVVTDAAIRAWIDDEQVVDVALAGRQLSTRPDVQPSLPLGIATWRTTAAVRHIYLRPVRE